MTDLEIIERVKADHEAAKKVDSFGGFHQKQVQSDKLGFDWIEDYLGDKLLKQVYVAQENPKGTIDNPIEWYDGVPMINNAFYLKYGHLYVYMDGQFIPWDLE